MPLHVSCVCSNHATGSSFFSGSSGGSSFYPPTHLRYAIFVTVFCCLPIGLCAIGAANRCSDAREEVGFTRVAEHYSRRCLLLCRCAAACGIIVLLALAIAGFLLFAAASWLL